jgi:hypothetical protein
VSTIESASTLAVGCLLCSVNDSVYVCASFPQSCTRSSFPMVLMHDSALFGTLMGEGVSCVESLELVRQDARVERSLSRLNMSLV